ncbi:N-acetylneuraminate synthase [Fodinicurvata sp. EGI_FJ10296]|uniref:N-acetylneuraminate synthase n=1 Tax=Fodinicurvata sp. EGI_FJ10296 TaxID=3231908 RepID=UPI00345676A1
MTDQPHTLTIAEAGVNHNGDLGMALALVDKAADARADFVKFQTFNAAKLASASAPKAAYQQRQTDRGESQLEMLTRLQLSADDHRAIIDRCVARGVRFLSTPFDVGSLDLLTREFGLREIKLGSGELTNGPLLLDVARTGVNVILSTGMGTLAEVEAALGVLAFGMLRTGEEPSSTAFADALARPEAWSLLRERVTLLHCTTEYPAAPADTNLRAMDTMRAAFGLRVGYSDHTEGNAISIAAVARGAEVIEKHFTLDRSLPGPDHAASLEPAELSALISEIRAVETALGSGIKQPSASEIANRPVARKSLFAARDLPADHVLTSDDIDVMRPGSGLSPMDYWAMLGKPTRRSHNRGDRLG